MTGWAETPGSEDLSSRPLHPTLTLSVKASLALLGGHRAGQLFSRITLSMHSLGLGPGPAQGPSLVSGGGDGAGPLHLGHPLPLSSFLSLPTLLSSGS